MTTGVELGDSRWEPVPQGSLSCGHSHPVGIPGRLDETARRLSHEEYAVARALAAEGHAVRSLGESRRGGRRPDLDVCGSGVEVKSWLPESQRTRPPGPRSVLNKLVDGSGQAPVVVLFARGSGLTGSAVRSGLAMYAAREEDRGLTTVRVLGDGFDLGWSRHGPPAPEMRVNDGRSSRLGAPRSVGSITTQRSRSLRPPPGLGL